MLFMTTIILLPMLCVPAMAAQNPTFKFELSIDGLDVKDVESGDIITVTLHLLRTDSDAPFTMYAMQSEIRYDSTFFELLPDSIQLYDGVQSNDIRVEENHRELYMNFLSFAGGTQWAAKTRVGTFQLKVIGTSGTTEITNEDFLVSTRDGSDGYDAISNKLTVILSTECVVRFETNGGSPIDPITVIYGEKIPRPEDPIREGKWLIGWFKDVNLTDQWIFKTDVVTGNTTLYAKWADGFPDPPAEDDGLHCIICGKDCGLILGIAICWTCFLIIILMLLVVVALLMLSDIMAFVRKDKDKQDDLVEHTNINEK